eukprot:Skav226706  [mRNA]  locus=scaffold3811:54642:59375:- [translate_table: standard]
MGLHEVIETCTGIGCLGEGVASCDMNIRVVNDMREVWCQFQANQPNFGSATVVGEIRDQSVVAKIHEHCPRSTMLTAGFSCQPWSNLGDQAGVADARSNAFFHTLEAGHLLRSHSILLECVRGAGKDKQVQDTLTSFCEATGFRCSQIDLSLHTVFPARRDRWWCILTHPSMPCITLDQLPTVSPAPKLEDVMPVIFPWDEATMKQIALDLYETRKYSDYSNFDSLILQGKGICPTALHGWANQLQGCPCGCRRHGLSDQRLQSKGIYAALLLLGGFWNTSNGPKPRTRFLHPWELSLIHGSQPNRNWGPNLRLAIAGLGQMASPIQSCWMIGQWKYQVGTWFDFPVLTPEEYLWKHVQGIALSVANTAPPLANHPNFGNFIGGIKQVLQALSDNRKVLCATIFNAGPSEGSEVVQHAPTDLPQETKNSQRAGRKDPEEKKSGVTNSFGDEKQPATGPQEPKENVPTSDLTPENNQDLCADSSSMPSFAHDHPTSFGNDHVGEVHASVEQATVSVIEPAREITDHGDQGMPDADEPGSPQVRPDPTANTGESPGSHVELSQDTLKAIAADADEWVPMNDEDAHRTNGNAEEAAEGHEPPQESLSTGGIPAFATNTQAEPVTFADQLTAMVKSKAASPPMRAEPEAEAAPVEHIVHAHDPEYRWIWVQHLGDTCPTMVKVMKDATIGQIQVAEARLLGGDEPVRVTNAVGTVLPPASEPQSFQTIYMEPLGQFDQRYQDSCRPELFLETHTTMVTRIAVLRNQQGWVASDEFAYYLERHVAEIGAAAQVPPLIIPSYEVEESLQDMLEGWSGQIVDLVATKKEVVSALLVNHQWIPAFSRIKNEKLEVVTTYEGKLWLEQAFAPVLSTLDQPGELVSVKPMQKAFEHDCGFQAIAWLRNVLFDLSDKVDAEEALEWRTGFGGSLSRNEAQARPLPPHALHFGGGKEPDLSNEVLTLLKAHGVPDEDAGERAATVLERLGRLPVQKCMRSLNAWRDLKALANQAVPRLQLVMSHEMETMVKARLQQNQTFGGKKQKKNKSPVSSKPLHLAADDISIPKGIFQDPQGGLLQQIAVSEVNPEASGVIVSTAAEATGYLRCSLPISRHALGLVLLDANNPRLHGVGDEIRIPAHFSSTSEPILTTVRLVQLGSQQVQRWKPPQVLQVAEVQTEVIRVIAYKDEIDDSWSDIVERPVKYVITKLPQLAVQSSGDNPIIDCWDRQFVTGKLERCAPKNASMFIVNLRVAVPKLADLLAKSGTSGLYVEPRTVDGRQPSPAFRVIWLPKQQKDDVQIALQSTPVEASMARYGERFGIRVQSADAERIHKQHRPSGPLLNSQESLLYVGGPFPFGTTKGSLVSLFQKWGWNARPLQPVGRAVAQTGLLWNIQASCAPGFEVYHLSHGDVLLSRVQKPTKPASSVPDIQASKQTMDHIKAQGSKQVEEDFMQTNDPWSGKTLPKQPKVDQGPKIDEIAVAIQKRVEANLASSHGAGLNTADSDVCMQEARVDEIEARMQRLEQTVQANHDQQQQQHVVVTNQIQQVRSHVDAQTRAVQNHFDAKLADQLSAIEDLLAKKHKSGHLGE